MPRSRATFVVGADVVGFEDLPHRGRSGGRCCPLAVASGYRSYAAKGFHPDPPCLSKAVDNASTCSRKTLERPDGVSYSEGAFVGSFGGVWWFMRDWLNLMAAAAALPLSFVIPTFLGLKHFATPNMQ